MDAQLGQDVARAAQQRKHPLHGRSRDRADPHIARQAGADLADLALGVVQLGQDACRASGEGLALRGEADAAPVAQAQRAADDALGLRKQAGCGRLRDAERVGRVAEPLRLGQKGQKLKMRELQTVSQQPRIHIRIAM